MLTRFAVFGFSLFTFANLISVCGADAEPRLHLRVPAGYLPDVPVLVRVEARHADGSFAREWWDATATLTASPTNVALSSSEVILRNGLGSALVRFTGGGDFALTATIGNRTASRSLRTLTNLTHLNVSGTLTGSNTVWSNLVRVTNTVTVPAGHTLTIRPGTWVLINGDTSGRTAPGLIVQGSIQSLGTEAEPITFTCPQPGARWGQIRHESAQPSLYRHTSITMAGRAAGEGHTDQAPVIRVGDSKIVFENCNLTDHADFPAGTPGKVLYGNNSDLRFDDCLLQRARMAMEIIGTQLIFTNSWSLDMHGPDDSDGIYPWPQQAGQIIQIAGSVIGFGDDDGIDTLASDVLIEDCIVRDWANPNEDAKGISAFNGQVTVRRSLFVNCHHAISAKCSDTNTGTRVNIDHCTVLGNERGLAAAFKENAPYPQIDFRVTNSIIRGANAIYTDYGPTNFAIGYCNLSLPWAGTAVQTNDPRFASEAAKDFRLRPFSSCIDAGDPAAPLDPDGSRTDLGFATFVPPAPMLTQARVGTGGNMGFFLEGYSNRNYTIEMSTNLVRWDPLMTVFQTNGTTRIRDGGVLSRPQRFYRATVRLR